MLRRLALVLLLAAFAGACKKDTSQASHAGSSSPVAAPATLTAEGSLRDPDAFWGKIRKGSGGALERMPETAAGAVFSWAGADPALASVVAGAQPFYIALGDALDGLAFAIAMKLGDPEAVRSSLVEGDTARYQGEDLDGMVHLLPRGDAAPATFALGIAWSGYLVIASSAADLPTLGAYAARTLPTKTAPASSFELRMDPAALLRTARRAPELAATGTASLTAMARGLLPPEVDAGAFAACFTPGMEDTVGMVDDLSEARIDADADDAKLDVIATLVPKPGDSDARRRVAAMHPASAAPLLDAPREAMAALFWSDTAQSRAEDVSTLGPCVGKALAPILGAGGGPKLADLLMSWAKGRGDWETASFVARPAVAGLVLRAPVTDGASVSSSLRGFVDLVSQPAFADAVRRLLPLRAGAVEPIDVPRVGKGSMVMFPTHPPFSRGTADPSAATVELAPPGLAWVADGKEVDVGLGQSPKDLLALTKPTTSLRSNAPVERAVTSLGAETVFAAVLAPPGCCTSAGPTSAPLTFGWGRHGGHGRASIAIGDELLGLIVARAAAQ